MTNIRVLIARVVLYARTARNAAPSVVDEKRVNLNQLANARVKHSDDELLIKTRTHRREKSVRDAQRASGRERARTRTPHPARIIRAFYGKYFHLAVHVAYIFQHFLVIEYVAHA